MAAVFSKALGGQTAGVGREAVQALRSLYLLGWLSPQLLVQPLPSTRPPLHPPQQGFPPLFQALLDKQPLGRHQKQPSEGPWDL